MKTSPNLWDTMKVVLRGKFIALDAYIKNSRWDITNLAAHMKPLEQQEKKRNRWQEILNSGLKINGIKKNQWNEELIL